MNSDNNPAHPRPRPSVPPLTVNFLHLLEVYGHEAGLPSLRDESTLVTALIKSMDVPKLGDAAIKHILHGRAAHHPHAATLKALKSVFKKLPDLKETWLLIDDAATFRSLVAATRPNLAVLSVPNLYNQTHALKDWLSGTFVAYRFAFHPEIEDEVAREVVHVEFQDRTLKFKMSFWAMGNRPNQTALIYSGAVLPIGESILYVGFSDHTDKPNRGRTLILHNEDAPSALRDCNIGLLTTTRMHGDNHPAVVCTVLVRVQWEPADLDSFIQEVTRIAPFSEIIVKDFGPQHSVEIKKYLDNRPHPKEQILRADSNRFNKAMPGILAALKKDADIFAPFKSNWPQRPGRPPNKASEKVD
jgi:hypothetical protein